MRKLGLVFALSTLWASACSGNATENGASGGNVGQGGVPASGGSTGGAQHRGGAGGAAAGSANAAGGAEAVGTGGAEAAGNAGVAGAAGGGDAIGAAGAADSAGAAGAASAAGAAGAAGVAGSGNAGVRCPSALPLKCGDRFSHSTVVQGRADTWHGYSATQRGESGRETVYAFEAPSGCSVVANLEDLTSDLDLLLLSACDPIANPKASSTPIDLQTVETVTFTTAANHEYYVVVDGYAGAEGSYTLEVDCDCN